MDSHVTVNVVEPDSTIQVPNTGGATTGGLSGYETGLIGVGLIVVVLALIATIVMVIKSKKDHRVFETNKELKFRAKKRLIFGAIILLALCGAFGFTATKMTEQEKGVSAFSYTGEIESPYGSFDNSIAISVSDIEVNVELDDEVAFGYAKSDVKVTSSTLGGYMLYMQADNTDLTNKKTGEKIESIPVSTYEEEEEQDLSNQGSEIESIDEIVASFFKHPLTENTWGYTLEKPKGADSAIWNGIASQDDDFPSIIKYTEEATEANDTTSLYYGVYITPDLSYGTYEGATISYVAIANFVEPDFTLKYVLDEGYFDETTMQTENAIGYACVCDDGTILHKERGIDLGEGCTWKRVDGKYKDPILKEGQSLMRDGWYVDGFDEWISRGDEMVLQALNGGMGHELAGETITAYSIVLDSFTIEYDANGGRFVKACEPTFGRGLIIDCENEEVSSISLRYGINDGYDNYYGISDAGGYNPYNENGDSLLGWSEDPNATIPTYYENEYIQVSPMMKGMKIKLYAVWGQRLYGTDKSL